MPPKKKGRKPAHQNEFAFKHNPKSKLTDKILDSPNVGLCRRCHDKIEWRKTYRKYKPLSQPSKCNICQRKNITAAYHTICSGCALSDKAWERVEAAKSINKVEQKTDGETHVQETKKIERPQGAKACAMCCKEIALKDENDTQEMDQKIEEAKEKMILKLGRPLKLRESKAIERKIERSEEREKQRAKEERRRLREEAENKAKGRNTDQSNDEQTNLDPLKEDEHENKEEVDSSVHRIVSDDDEEEDEFLKKVGGSILTGEAYQEMLLQKEKLQKI